MTIAELIEHLKAHDQNLTVVVGGFDEWGFDNIKPEHWEMVRAVPVAPLSHGPDYEDPDNAHKPHVTITGEEISALKIG